MDKQWCGQVTRQAFDNEKKPHIEVWRISKCITLRQTSLKNVLGSKRLTPYCSVRDCRKTGAFQEFVDMKSKNNVLASMFSCGDLHGLWVACHSVNPDWGAELYGVYNKDRIGQDPTFMTSFLKYPLTPNTDTLGQDFNIRMVCEIQPITLDFVPPHTHTHILLKGNCAKRRSWGKPWVNRPRGSKYKAHRTITENEVALSATFNYQRKNLVEHENSRSMSNKSILLIWLEIAVLGWGEMEKTQYYKRAIENGVGLRVDDTELTTNCRSETVKCRKCYTEKYVQGEL